MAHDNQGYQPDDPEVALGEALEHLQLTLSIEMRRLRKREGLTQGELGERMGVNQSTVSKLENANVHSDLESLLKYVFALGADLVLGIFDGQDFIPVSEAAEEWCEGQVSEPTQSEEPVTSGSRRWQRPSASSHGEPRVQAKVIPLETASDLLKSRTRKENTWWSVDAERKGERGSGGFETDKPIAG